MHPRNCRCGECPGLGQAVEPGYGREVIDEIHEGAALGAVSSNVVPISCSPSTPKSLCGPRGGPPPPVFPDVPWLFPVPGGYVTSQFGCRFSPTVFKCRPHQGVDIGKGEGASIVAPADGVVVYINDDSTSSAGRNFILKHRVAGRDVFSWYMHNLAIAVVMGQSVKRGQQISLMGKTGQLSNGAPAVTGPHLHWEIYMKSGSTKLRFDPMYYISGIHGSKGIGLFSDKLGLKYRAAKGINAPAAGTVQAVQWAMPILLFGAAGAAWWAWRNMR